MRVEGEERVRKWRVARLAFPTPPLADVWRSCRTGHWPRVHAWQVGTPARRARGTPRAPFSEASTTPPPLLSTSLSPHYLAQVGDAQHKHDGVQDVGLAGPVEPLCGERKSECGRRERQAAREKKRPNAACAHPLFAAASLSPLSLPSPPHRDGVEVPVKFGHDHALGVRLEAVDGDLLNVHGGGRARELCFVRSPPPKGQESEDERAPERCFYLIL